VCDTLEHILYIKDISLDIPGFRQRMSRDIPKCFLYIKILGISHDIPCLGGCHGRDHMVVGFTTTCAISTYHH